MNTIPLPIFLLFASTLCMGAAPASSPAETSVPSPTSQPVIPPGEIRPPSGQSPAVRFDSTPLMARIYEVVQRPDAYIGKQVRLSSKVEEVLTPWVLRLGEDPPLANLPNPNLLLIAAEPLVTMGFKSGWQHKTVNVVGTVRILQAADFLREYGRGVDDRLFRRYEGQPVFVATFIELAQ